VVELARTGAEAVVVTPGHQFPTGAVLSARRRSALVEWAERGDRLVIEDDYDGELCRDRVGALQAWLPTGSSTSAPPARG
jgi:GntR family transcriptional regulator/MocR family aminotransferase